eukprot:417966-Amphidinium_carterae.1
MYSIHCIEFTYDAQHEGCASEEAIEENHCTQFSRFSCVLFCVLRSPRKSEKSGQVNLCAFGDASIGLNGD